jgi:hypothetical protein
MHLPIDEACAYLRKHSKQVAYLRAVERRGDRETDQIAHITNEVDDPILALHTDDAVAKGADERADQLCEALRDQLASYCDVPEPIVVRIHIYGPKGLRLTSFTVRTGGSPESREPQHLSCAPSRFDTIEMTTVDDVLTQRVMWTMKLGHDHTATVHANYQKIFDVVERLLTKSAGLMEQRATRAERHVLDVMDKRIAEKRVELDLSADDRKKEGEVAVKEKAIETAGGVIEKLLGGVLGSLGLDTGAIGQLSGLMGVLDGDPELKAMISDPATVNALKNAEVRNIVKGMFHNFKTGTLDADDVAGATPEA